jgi:hypothetical protein
MMFSDKVKINPHIGNNYFKVSPRILILGESAYDIKHKGDRDLLVNAINHIINGVKKSKYTKYPQTKRFFTKLYNLFNGKKYSDKKSFYDDICFYDYIQEILKTSREKLKDKILTKYFEEAKEPFEEIIKKLKPDIIIILGFSKTYSKLSFLQEEGKTIKISNETKNVLTWKYKIKEKTIYICKIQHPSSYRFEKEVWIKLYNKFLREYNKNNL